MIRSVSRESYFDSPCFNTCVRPASSSVQVSVPALFPGQRTVTFSAFAAVPIPEWVLGAFPKIHVPVQVIWGMEDIALLPMQLDGLDQADPEIRRIAFSVV